MISTQFSERVISKKLLDRIILLIYGRRSIMRSRMSQMSFGLGDLRSHRKPMRCVTRRDFFSIHCIARSLRAKRKSARRDRKHMLAYIFFNLLDMAWSPYRCNDHYRSFKRFTCNRCVGNFKMWSIVANILETLRNTTSSTRRVGQFFQLISGSPDNAYQLKEVATTSC